MVLWTVCFVLFPFAMLASWAFGLHGGSARPPSLGTAIFFSLVDLAFLSAAVVLLPLQWLASYRQLSAFVGAALDAPVDGGRPPD